eukprot:15432743-Alexandrium_andersonii.AAC.1
MVAAAAARSAPRSRRAPKANHSRHTQLGDGRSALQFCPFPPLEAGAGVRPRAPANPGVHGPLILGGW